MTTRQPADTAVPTDDPSHAAPVDVALVGYGFVGKTVHAPLLASVPGLRLHTIVSSRGAQVQQDWPDARVVADADTAFADPAIQLVVIAAPNQAHAPLARAALAQGKHVVVDKPFTVDLAEAHAVVKHAEEAGRLLSVFHNRRWDSEFLTLRRLLADDVLGDIVELHSHYDRYRPLVQDRWRERPGPGAGLWFDLGSHLTDQALVLFGMPEAVYADISAQRPGAMVDDYFHVLLRYPAAAGGRRVLLHGSSLAMANGLRFIAHGTRASFVKYGIDSQEQTLRNGGLPGRQDWGADTQPGQLTTATTPTAGASGGPAATPSAAPVVTTVPSEPGDYRCFYTGMRDAILHGAPLPVTPSQALDVMTLLERGVESARTRREVSCAT
jgi:predicted dehydrogenase